MHEANNTDRITFSKSGLVYLCKNSLFQRVF